MLTDYWKQKDRNTGETWLSFAQRTDMDAVSIAFGQAWQDHIDSRAATSDSLQIESQTQPPQPTPRRTSTSIPKIPVMPA